MIRVRTLGTVVALALSALSSHVALVAGAEPAVGTEESRPITPENYDRLRLGDGDGQRVIVPTNQVLSPLGQQIAFSSRPTALALSPNRRWLGVLCHNRVLTVDLDARRIAGQAERFSGSFTGIIFTRDGASLLASNIKGTIQEYAIDAEGGLKAVRSIPLPPLPEGRTGNDVPAGLTLDPQGKTFWAALNLSNTVAEIELDSGRVLRQIPVGNAPYDVVFAAGKLYVSNWAGRHPQPGDVAGPSGRAAAVRVDREVPYRLRRLGFGRRSGTGPRAQGDRRGLALLGAGGLARRPFRLRGQRQQRYGFGDRHRARRGGGNHLHAARPGTSVGQCAERLGVQPRWPHALRLQRRQQRRGASWPSIRRRAGRWAACRRAGIRPGLAFDPQRQALYVANVKGIGSRNTDAKGKRKVKGEIVWGYNSLDPVGTRFAGRRCRRPTNCRG